MEQVGWMGPGMACILAPAPPLARGLRCAVAWAPAWDHLLQCWHLTPGIQDERCLPEVGRGAAFGARNSPTHLPAQLP